MAKITLHLDTDDWRDAALLVAIGAEAEIYRNAGPEQEWRETTAMTAEPEKAQVVDPPTRRVRRTREQITADNAAAQQATPPESTSETTGAGPGPDATSGVTLEQINAKLTQILETREGMGQACIDAIKRVTGGKHSRSRDLPAEYWPAVMAALEAI